LQSRSRKAIIIGQQDTHNFNRFRTGGEVPDEGTPLPLVTSTEKHRFTG